MPIKTHDPRTHRDVEFFAKTENGESEAKFNRFRDAAEHAVVLAASRGGKVFVDVCIYSRAGAQMYGGDHAVEEYEADPEASVHERLVITAVSQGRVS